MFQDCFFFLGGHFDEPGGCFSGECIPSPIHIALFMRFFIHYRTDSFSRAFMPVFSKQAESIEVFLSSAADQRHFFFPLFSRNESAFLFFR